MILFVLWISITAVAMRSASRIPPGQRSIGDDDDAVQQAS